jgi:hypothetical protein
MDQKQTEFSSPDLIARMRQWLKMVRDIEKLDSGDQKGPFDPFSVERQSTFQPTVPSQQCEPTR